jgi:hypothetical protein
MIIFAEQTGKCPTHWSKPRKCPTHLSKPRLQTIVLPSKSLFFSLNNEVKANDIANF